MLKYEVPEYKKIRVIVDSDAACEADDPFAIAQALMTKKFDIRGIFAEQFGDESTTARSYDEIKTVLACMEMDVPVFMGEEGNLHMVQGKPLSPAAKFLIEEALRKEERPLYVLCLGGHYQCGPGHDGMPGNCKKHDGTVDCRPGYGPAQPGHPGIQFRQRY